MNFLGGLSVCAVLFSIIYAASFENDEISQGGLIQGSFTGFGPPVAPPKDYGEVRREGELISGYFIGFNHPDIKPHETGSLKEMVNRYLAQQKEGTLHSVSVSGPGTVGPPKITEAPA